MSSWWKDIIFADSWALWFLFLVPVIGFLTFYFSGKGRPAVKLSSFRYLQNLSKPGIVKWRAILPVLRLITLSMLVFAFARPQSRTGWKRRKGEGIDVMICLDVSPSMGADFSGSSSSYGAGGITRLDAAKQEANHFIVQRPNDRIGAVIFSAEPFTVCPLTTDHEALKNLITNIDAGPLEEGTAIGMGLAMAVDRIKDSKAKSKVIILLTDGENNAGTITPIDAGRLAKTFDIRVYTIGLGAQGADVLTPNAVNPGGSYTMSYQNVDIDENTLMQIAEMNGGKYFRAGDNHKLETIYNEINRLEKTAFDKSETEERKEEFLPFLVIALSVSFLEFILRNTLFNWLT